ncbi:MAG TPA: transcriptional regulator [Natrialbaceae archaeon]|nr:transcriptional regulator [Natrialbaceae archaeon]
MDSRTRERVEDWAEVPCAAGLDGLRDLADQEFSGVVTGTGTWAYVLNGRVVGLSGGTLDDLEGLPLTAYEAPDPALPLLFAMQEAGGETQAQYYTNDTPIAEAKKTLSDGSFTGYVELSENVLSGDYYVCFYGGRALPVAFIGSSERLLTGDEAFERANDEVGIYEVKAVDIEVIEIPEPEDDAGASGVSGAAGTGISDDSDDEAAEDESGPAADDEEEPAPETADPDAGTPAAAETTADAEETDDEAVESPAESGTGEAELGSESTSTAERPAGEDSTGPANEPRTEPSDEDDGGSEGARPTETPSRDTRDDATPSRESTESTPRKSPETDRDSRTTTEQADEPRRSAARQNEGRPRETATPRTPREMPGDPTAGGPEGARSESGSTDDPRFEREAEWRETRRIPSIDPDQSEEADEPRKATGGRERPSPARSNPKRQSDAQGSPRRDRRPAESKRSDARSPAESTGSRSDRSTAKSGASDSKRAASPPDGSIEKPLEQDMLEREDEIDRLQQRVSDLESKRETLQAERDTLEREKETLAEENERLQTRVDELEDEVAALESQIEELEATLESGGAAGTTGDATGGSGTSRGMSPQQALSATNLFLRYDSKGQATLEDVHAGDADAEALNANLRLEHHTSFDATNVEVEGTPYERFLETSIHYEFVDWLLRDLPFEIRETGNAKTMDELYDVIPEIDRVECMGTVDIPTDDEDGGDLERQFDVVARDRMGNPLIIANVNDSLDAATENMMVSLQESATAVKEAHDDLGAAFMVTTSFFDPGALEVASEATSGSLLSRDSRKSFVKLSRKRGYHLCLVETREGNFHVNVPEL